MNRDRFPGLRHGQARLDGPAGSQPLDTCAAAVSAYLSGAHVANLDAPSVASGATQALLDDCRASVARLLGGHPDGVVLGPSATVLTARFADALAERLSPGDEIVCTDLDHDANVSPWLELARRTGAKVRLARADPVTLDLSVGAISAVVSPRTRIVAMTAASNVTGTLPDLQAVGEVVRAAGALWFLDAVHAVAHGPAEVAACGADALVCSAYKWFGPHVSVLSVRPALLDTLRPARIRPAPLSGPKAWERGALAFELLPGLIDATDYMHQLDWVAARRHEGELLEALLAGLDELHRVSFVGAPSRRTGTVAFNVDGFSSGQVAQALAGQDVAVNCGDFYAVELFAGLGIDSAVRAGVLHYNDHDDVGRLLDAVRRL